MRIHLLAVLFLMWSLPAHAESLNADEQALLNQTRDNFLQALAEKDFDVVVSVIPPRIVEHIAEKANVTVKELLSAMPLLFAEAMKAASFSHAEILTEDLDATRAVDGDQTFAWGFAQSRFDLTMNGQKVKVEGHTLALLDAGKWYLVRMSEADKVALIRQVYPFFAEVEFPASTTTPVE